MAAPDPPVGRVERVFESAAELLKRRRLRDASVGPAALGPADLLEHAVGATPPVPGPPPDATARIAAAPVEHPGAPSKPAADERRRRIRRLRPGARKARHEMPPAPEPDLMSPELIADPRAGYGKLRERAPVLRGRAMDGGPAWYVTRQDEVRAVLGDPRFVNDVRSVPGLEGERVRDTALAAIGVPHELACYLTDSILDRDGDGHVRLRRLVSRAFTEARVVNLRPRVEEIVARLLEDDAHGSEPLDLVASFAYPLPITVICELVGVPEADRPSWRRWGAALVSMNPTGMPSALRNMVAHTRHLIAQRRSEPADDLLSGLIEAQEDDGDRFTETELITMVFSLVVSGHETTAHLISNGAYALLTHPDQLDLLRGDATLWPGAVHELTRWCGPVQVTRLRYAATDIRIGGVRIRKGDAVQAVLVSANFDPRVHAEPDRLDVTRRPPQRGDAHVGFGHGAHYCLGADLARQEGEVALHALFDRFPNLRLDIHEPEWVPMPGMRALARLPVLLH